jgi:DNA-binding NarL/FixJ family response regulator
VVEAHGGTIGVRSEPERGAVFTMTLPACIVEERKVKREEPAMMAWRNVMLVDDDPEMISSWRRIIDGSGGSIRYTATSADAVMKDGKLDAANIDTAIVDYRYEGYSATGVDLIKFLKKQGVKEVHLCTGFHDDEDIRKRAKEAGATSIIPKPIDERSIAAMKA